MKMQLSIPRVSGVLSLATALVVQSAAFADEGRFASFLPPSNPVIETVANPFIERVKKDSGGELTYKLFSGGALLTGKTTVQGLRAGVADIGQVVFNYNPSEFPHTILVGDMAMYGDLPPAVTAATTEYLLLHCNECIDEYKKQGLVVLGGAAATPFQLMGNEDVSTLDALEGKKVRAPGGAYGRWVASVGAVPVSMPSSEMYEALSRGTVDLVVNPLGAMKSHSLWDVAKKVTLVDLGAFRPWGVVVVSTRHWNELSDEQHQILMKNASISLIDTSFGYQAKDDEVLAEAAANGLELIEPSEEVRQSIVDFKAADWATVIEQAQNKHGISEPEAMMIKIVELIEKWEDKFEPIKDDKPAMSDMLYREVLSKVDPRSLGM